MGELGPEYCQFLFHVRIFNIKVGAAAAQGFAQGPRPVGGQYHEGDGLCPHRSHLGNGHLHFGKQLQQEGFKFLVCLINFVDEQHHRLFRADGLQQGPLQQVFIAEEGFCQAVAVLGVHVHLNGKQLLLVVPLIQGFTFVQPFIALQAHQLPA